MKPGPFVHVFTVLALCACQREQRPEAPPAREFVPPAPTPWTAAFLRPAVLVADEIVIEGPADLLDHVVLRPDPETNVYVTKTVTAGLLQELSARPESRMEVRGQLDTWSLAAFQKLTVLQRPGEVPVTVRARGNAYWAPADGSGERRGPEFVFQGVRGE